jgi:hypothetical protein
MRFQVRPEQNLNSRLFSATWMLLVIRSDFRMRAATDMIRQDRTR